jgi:hypothetical protein
MQAMRRQDMLQPAMASMRLGKRRNGVPVAVDVDTQGDVLCQQ